MEHLELNPKDREWLTYLQTIAIDLPKVAGVRIISALVEGRVILGMGWNQYRSHPLQAQFSSNPDSIYLHAEIDSIAKALRRCREFHHFGRSTLYVVRVGAKGEMRLARPCEGCWRAIHKYEIGRIVWST